MSCPTLKAIDTYFDGYYFRSRLEARWAVFYKTLGIPYEYEKEGFELEGGIRYLPDFWLPDQQCWVEIKGERPTVEETKKAQLLAIASHKNVHIFFGEIPNPDEIVRRHYPEFQIKKDISSLCYLPAYADDPDICCVWAECPGCGSLSIGLYGYVSCKCLSKDIRNPTSRRILKAYRAARTARFEVDC